MLGKLRDPESARIRNLRPGSDGVVCGEVNAKTSHGGYLGFLTFFYEPKLKRAFVPGGQAITTDILDSIAATADRFCR